MIKKLSGWHIITLTFIMILMLSCALPFSSNGGVGGGNVQNETGAGGGGQNGAGVGGGGQNGAGGTNNSPNSQVPNSNTTTGSGGPYAVKQILSLGGETISGDVCSVVKPFNVNVTSSKVTFEFIFVGTKYGNAWSYEYNIPRAGETHAAAGTYTLNPAGSDGTLLLTMTGKDHVTFKGFDGTFPVNYKFNLVPSQYTSCTNP
jgi:hypothetical protein